MPTRSYAEGRDLTNIRTSSMTAEEVVMHSDMRLRAYSYASPALIRRNRRSRLSSNQDVASDEPPQPPPWAPGDEEPKEFADYLAQVQALLPGETASHKLVTHFPLKAYIRAESKEHVLYYDIKQEQWTEDKEEVVGQPLTTSTRVRRYWDEEEPAPREASEATITNPPPKSPNIFSAFSLVHYARTWRKKAKRRFMIVRDMYSKAGEDVVIPTISKTPEVKATLWKAIQANEMLRSMDESTVMRMLMAMTHETHAAQEVVSYQGDPPKLFVVESGRVESSFRKLGSKVDHPLACFSKGQVMGEVTMIGGGHKAPMTLTADVDSSLYVLERAVFVAIMKHETMIKNRLAFMRSVCLDGTAVFKALTDSDMMRWALHFVEFTVDKGYHFTVQGKTGTDWYLVMAGEVEVLVNDVGVRKLGKYSWFGEGAALSGNNLRNASCVATMKTTVLKLDGTLCEKLFPWLPFTKVYQNRCITNVLKELPLPLMKNLHDSDAAAIEGLFRVQSFRQGDTVVTQGAPVTHFYIMTKGEVSVLQHPDPLPNGPLPPSGSQGSLNGGMGDGGMSGGMSASVTPFAQHTSRIPGMGMPDNNASPSPLPMPVRPQQPWASMNGASSPMGAMMGGGVGQSPGDMGDMMTHRGPGSWESLQPQEVATLRCGPQGHFGFKGMVTGGTYGGSVVVKSAQMDCVMLHVSQWQELLSIVHRRHWVDQIATWPLFATLNAIQLRTLNDNLQYVQFPAGQVVVPAGRVDTRLYLVVQGEAVGVDPFTKRARGSVMRSGQFFGEDCLLSCAPYEYSVVAASALRCFYLDKQYIETNMGHLEALLWEYVAWKRLKNRNVDNPIINRLKDRTLALSNLNVHRVLGKGQFGKVILVSSTQTGIKYALKVLNKADIVDQGQVEHVRDEKDVLECLDHPFCNQLVSTFHDKANVYMLISLCQGGDLLAAQESWKNHRMDESCVQFYLACIVLALEYMHSLNIAYRDMKQENMMIDAQGYLKMVDYGLSKVVSDGTKAFTVCGTAQFIAPEVITCKGHGKEVDMWSLGVLAFELLVGESPFVDDSDMEPEEIFKSIVRGSYKIPSFVSTNAADLIMNLLRREPNARLGCGVDGFKRLKEHAFFRTMDWRRLLRRQITPPFVPNVRDETSKHTSLKELLDWDEDEYTPVDPQVEALLDQHF